MLKLVLDVFDVVKREKKVWLLPLLLLLLLVAGLFVFVAMTGPLAPFLYPLL